MSEDAIERQVERMTDNLDSRFMAGEMTQAEYDQAQRVITRWADDQRTGNAPLRRWL